MQIEKPSAMQLLKTYVARILSHKNRVRPRYALVGVLAVVVLVGSAGAVLYQNQNHGQQSSQKTAPIKVKSWQTEDAKLEQAQKLFAEGKLDEAAVLLGQINAQYPHHVAVTDLQKAIETKKSEIAKKAAEEQAKLNTPASRQTPAKQTQTPVSPAFSTPIEIRGDATCQTATLGALELLSTKAPAHYATATQYISIIECAPQGSGM
jgi:hypothetical protein